MTDPRRDEHRPQGPPRPQQAGQPVPGRPGPGRPNPGWSNPGVSGGSTGGPTGGATGGSSDGSNAGEPPAPSSWGPPSGAKQQVRGPVATKPRAESDRGPESEPNESSPDYEPTAEEETSPIAMAAAAVAAARDRFTRGSSGDRAERSAGAESTAVSDVPPVGLAAVSSPQRVESRAPQRQTTASAPRPGSVRRARLRLVRVDPWSVMKTAFMLSVAFGIMCVVAVFVIWSVLSAANVFGSINTSVEQIIETEFRIEEYVGMDRVLPFTMLVAVVDVVLITAIATLGAFLYNLAASLLGGLEVTLAEDTH